MLESIVERLPFRGSMPAWSWPLIAAAAVGGLWLWARRRRRRGRGGAPKGATVGASPGGAPPPNPPSPRPATPRLGALTVAVARRPREERAAGDFQDAFPLGEDRVGIVLGEVTGSGPEVAEMAALIRYTLRAHLTAGLEPRAALQAAESAARGLEDEFVSAIVAAHDPATGVLAYAAAGHPPPLLVGAPAHEPVSVCCAPPFGLGVATGVRQTSVPFPRGSVACFYTGGLADAIRGFAPVGAEQLAELVRRSAPGADSEGLLTRVRASAEPADDVALCLVRADEGSDRRAPRVEELEVAPRELDSGGPARFLHACGVPSTEADQLIAAARDVAPAAGLTLRVEIRESEVAVDFGRPLRAAPGGRPAEGSGSRSARAGMHTPSAPPSDH